MILEGGILKPREGLMLASQSWTIRMFRCHRGEGAWVSHPA
jgi:hypothetical protein